MTIALILKHLSIESREKPLIYVDCNAVNPETTKRLESLFRGYNATNSVNKQVRFLDGSIIGGPPHEGYDPAFYVSANANPEDQAALGQFVDLGHYGMRIKPLQGDGVSIGDASALKMCYAGISKGLIGLLMTTTLSSLSLLYHKAASTKPFNSRCSLISSHIEGIA